MTLIQAAVLGIVQGLTEFLPISSSAHLVLVPRALGWQFDPDAAFIFFVLVQWGTLLGVLAYYWSDLWPIGVGMLHSLDPRQRPISAEARLGWLLLLASLPAMVAGLLFKDTVEATFTSQTATGLFLLVTALLLVVAELVGRRNQRAEEVTPKSAFWIGVFQALSLFPGVSRSGATISGGMVNRLTRPAAARFAFLMSVPVMIGAGVLALVDLGNLSGAGDLVAPLIAGFLAAALVGYAAIRWLLSYLARNSLYPFAIYCTLIGLLAVFLN